MDVTDKKPEELARHFAETGDRKQAYRYFVEAGDEARPSSSADALAFYEAALQQWDPRDHPDEISRDDIHMLIRHAHHFALCSRREEAWKANARIFDFLTDDMLLERGMALRARGYLSMVSVTNIEQGEQDLLEALRIFQELQDHNLIATALRNLTSLYQRTGQGDSAVATARLAAEAHRDNKENPFAEGFALLCEGDALYHQDRFTEARPLLEGAFAQLKDEEGNLQVQSAGQFIYALGDTYFCVGEFDKANALFHEEVDRCRKLGIVGLEADFLRSLSDVAFEQGNMVRAESFAKEALECCPDYKRIFIFIRLAAIYASVGNVEEAKKWFEKSEWTPHSHPGYVLHLSRALSMMGEHDEAEKGFRHLANVDEAKKTFFGARALSEAGAFYGRMGYIERSRELLQSAGSILNEMGATHFAQKAFRWYRELPEQPLSLSRKKNIRDRLGSLIGQSDTMQQVYELIEQAAGSEVTVLLRGETGTGKEIAAREIHLRSGRLEGPFLSLNCSALSDELLLSELFGHRKGAFTGADKDRVGLFEAADGGTIFLDEIGDASDRAQSSLLRVLQEGEIRRVGENITRRVNARVITATNCDLEKSMEEGRFRKDLYYRLQVYQIDLPPLRDRIEDVPILAAHLLTNVATDDHVLKLSRPAIRTLMNYDWPGNVRELENEMRRLVAVNKAYEAIGPEMISERVRRGGKKVSTGETLQAQVMAFEKQVIVETLSACGNSVTRAAARLGLSRQGLYKKMARFGLNPRNGSDSDK